MKNRKKKLQAAVDYLMSIDLATSAMISKVGECKLKPIGTPYQIIIRSIIAQQLSSKAAASIQKKLYESLDGDFSNTPSPQKFLDTSDIDMRACGLSFSKIQTIQLIAKEYETKSLSDDELSRLTEKEIVQKLTSYKGIGPWTVEMVMIFALDRWDYFSIGDLGLRRGIELVYKIPRDNKKEILDFVQKFSPYRSILSWYLWAYFDEEPW